MVGKIKVTSTGYDPAKGAETFDPTLPGEPAGQVSRETRLTPVGRRILVAPVDQGEREMGGLVVETAALAKELRLCAVLAVGPKVGLAHAAIKPGCAVWLKPYFGTELIVNGYTVLLIKPEDVQGIANLKG